MNQFEADIECLEERFCPAMPRKKPRTKADEHNLCAAIDHLLLHRSRKIHSCKCGYRVVLDDIKSGECPECSEMLPTLEEGDPDMKAQILISILAETIRQFLDQHGCGCQACARARANLLLVEEEYRRDPWRKAS
jgi:hypothetical protein